MQRLNDKRHPDYEGGVRGYYERVVRCPVCGRLTNLIHKTASGRLVVTCCQACADRR
jgi:translation initiation factor 2 beta subunit (eIF-2beta)/eIF-5